MCTDLSYNCGSQDATLPIVRDWQFVFMVQKQISLVHRLGLEHSKGHNIINHVKEKTSTQPNRKKGKEKAFHVLLHVFKHKRIFCLFLESQ